ncbi:hypothetical protein SDC9_178494 [bioreactor metagenome]|uniref:Chromate transport protein n=1 Tax=bioreactor metagenome TaxID=1076179 RepID=A0A645H597_9ZZZZ
MLDYIAIAQSSPGAMAVNVSVLVGYRLAGLGGAFVTILGTVMPPLIILTAISFFYTAFTSNVIVANVLRGMQAGVCAVIMDVVYDMGSKIVKQKSVLLIFDMLFAFFAVFVLNINVIYVILAAAALGLVSIINPKRQKEDKEKNDIS